MALTVLSVAVQKKLKRRLQKQAGLRLRGRVMTGKARALLLELKGQAGSISPTQKVFNAYARTDGYSLAFRRATKEVGLGDIRLHDLRHEATTRIAALCGHNTSLIKRVTGHRDDASLARYTYTSTNSIARLMSHNAGNDNGGNT